MVKFLGDIALTIELLVVAGGLIALHFSRKEDKATLLKTASYTLIVGGLLLGLCTSFFQIRYFFQGDYQHALISNGKSFHGMHHRSDRRGGEKLFRNFHKRKDFNRQDQLQDDDQPQIENNKQEAEPRNEP